MLGGGCKQRRYRLGQIKFYRQTNGGEKEGGGFQNKTNLTAVKGLKGEATGHISDQARDFRSLTSKEKKDS